METQSNKVTVDLDVYNNLRDFEKGIKENHTLKVYNYCNIFGSRIFEIYTMNDAVIKLVEINKILRDKIEILKNPTEPIKEEKTISEIKKMNWLQFLIWKRRIH